MKTIEISTATKPLAEYADGLDDEAIILTSHGEPVAALVPLRDGERNEDHELSSLGLNPIFQKIIAQAEAEFDARKKLSFEEMSRKVNEE